MINSYKIYGLNIKSEIEIEEFDKLEEIHEENVVTITYSKIEKEIKDEIEKGSKIEILKDKIWFHIPNIATYLISNGSEIKVEVCEGADMKLMKVYLMCSCLGFIMLQRNMVAIHGGVIEIDGKAMIFTGDRGAGKSTLTTALRQRGYKFISDDVAAINFDEKVPYVMPGFPYQKLCEDAMDNMGYDKEKCTSFMSDKHLKYMVPAHDEFINNPTELFGICELTVDDVDKVTIEEYKGSEKLNKIIENIYRGEYIKYLGGMNPVYFKKCLDIAKHIKFYKITRPRNKFTVDEQIELIEREILGLKEAVV